jgi:flagellar hook-length control protein FliK
MTPVNPSPTGTSGGAQQLPAPVAAQTAAPTDFLSLLAQIVGEPAKQAITPVVMAASGGRLDGNDESNGDAENAVSADTLALLPISLPVMTSEVRLGASANPASANIAALADAAGLAASSRSALAAGEAQLLRDMIQTEQATTRDAASALDSVHLPSTESPLTAKSAHAAEALLARPVQTPVGSARWADEIGARLTVMAGQGKHSASLRLSPEHLGPLEIRIAIRDDQASVWFGAAHADTRAAIEHALPRLRELFESQGMSLADAGVFHEAPREQQKGEVPNTSPLHDPTEQPDAPSLQMALGLIDAYA